MSERMLFRADHPITLTWTAQDGKEVVRPGRLHSILRSEYRVLLHERPPTGEEIPLGGRARIKAADYHGRHLSVFRGRVASVDSRLISVKTEGSSERVQRRRHARTAFPRRLATFDLVDRSPVRHLLGQPLDLSEGGIKFRHHQPIEAGERFRLSLRLGGRGVVVTPAGAVIETWEERDASDAFGLGASRTRAYISRASFSEISDHDRGLIRSYVAWKLRNVS
jgi:hypothetical protein